MVARYETWYLAHYWKGHHWLILECFVPISFHDTLDFWTRKNLLPVDSTRVLDNQGPDWRSNTISDRRDNGVVPGRSEGSGEVRAHRDASGLSMLSLRNSIGCKEPYPLRNCSQHPPKLQNDVTSLCLLNTELGQSLIAYSVDFFHSCLTTVLVLEYTRKPEILVSCSQCSIYP